MDIRDLALIDTTCKPLPGTIVACLMCAKPFLMRKYSGVPDQVCPECFDTYKDCASVICSKCNVVIGRVDPKVLTNGYYIRPRAVLHVDHCNVCSGCQPGQLPVSTVMEIDEHEKQMGIKPRIIVPANYKGNTK